MPFSWIVRSHSRRSCTWPIAWVAATATGSTTSNEIAAVMTSATSVGRLRNSRCDSKRLSIGHIAMAITQAHAMAGMKSRITHSAMTSSAATSTARETCCVRGRAAGSGDDGTCAPMAPLSK